MLKLTGCKKVQLQIQVPGDMKQLWTQTSPWSFPLQVKPFFFSLDGCYCWVEFEMKDMIVLASKWPTRTDGELLVPRWTRPPRFSFSFLFSLKPNGRLAGAEPKTFAHFPIHDRSSRPLFLLRPLASWIANKKPIAPEEKVASHGLHTSLSVETICSLGPLLPVWKG